MLFKNVKNLKAYFAPQPAPVGATAALKAAARRRRAHVLKPASPLATVNTATKVHFSESAHRRALLATSSVKLVVSPTSSPTRAGSHTTIPLPAHLERPTFREVDGEALAALNPDMKGMPADYVRDVLESIGAKMLAVLASTSTPPVATSSSSGLPKEVPVTVHTTESTILPTHMLAVHSSSQAQKAARKVTLFPAHSLVLAAHCANLPALPSASTSAAPSTSSDSETHLTLPVLPLALPSPETFATLSSYLYTRRTDQLLAALVPSSIPNLSAGADRATSLAALTARMASLYSASALLAHALKVHGVWRNACALGVHDEKLWKVLDVAWAACVGALGKATGAAR